LETTSPLRDIDNIYKAIELLIAEESAESIVGICKTENAHPDFLVYADDKKFLKPYNKEKFIFKRRQEIDNLYFFEGSLYISYVESFKKRQTFYHNRTLGYEMRKYQSFEIDDTIDFKIVETLMTAKLKGEI
jgi:N-acylneuraminate cytidylyltransferase/CMP-N,N'-diacetyllegionaminic acid synthase